MFEYMLTIKSSKQVLADLLQIHGWSVAKVARTAGISRDEVRRIQIGKHSFCSSNVEALAQATGQKSYDMIFNAINSEEISPRKRGLYDLALKMIEQQRELSEAVTAKPAKKPRSRSTATAVKTSTKPAARRAFART